MRFTILILAAVAFLFLQSCGPDAPTAKEVVIKEITSGGWKISSVTVDGSNETDTYKDLNLTFTESTYTAINGEPMWPASGTWKFQDKDATIIIRDDGLLIDVVESSKERLTISLFWSKTVLGPGRTKALEGEHIFTFEH